MRVAGPVLEIDRSVGRPGDAAPSFSRVVGPEPAANAVNAGAVPALFTAT